MFKVGDVVEIVSYRRDLNGHRGLIVEMRGDRARIYIADIRRGLLVFITFDKLRKVVK